MKRFLAAMAVLVTGLVSFPVTVSSAELQNAVSAVVNGEIITLYEVETTVRQIAFLRGIPLTDENLSELRRQIINRMIEDKLLEQELKRLGVELSDEEVEKRLGQILKENNLTEEQLITMLKNQGKTLFEFREEIRKQLGMEEYVRYKLKAGSLDVSEEEALTYYRLHLDEFSGEATVSILILSWAATEENLESAEELYQRLATGAMEFDSEKIEQKASDSGAKSSHIEGVKESELKEDLANMIKGVEPPACATVHRDENEITLVVLLDRTASNVVPFEQAKRKIMNSLKNKKLEREFRFLIDELYRKSRVEIRMQF